MPYYDIFCYLMSSHIKWCHLMYPLYHLKHLFHLQSSCTFKGLSLRWKHQTCITNFLENLRLSMLSMIFITSNLSNSHKIVSLGYKSIGTYWTVGLCLSWEKLWSCEPSLQNFAETTNHKEVDKIYQLTKT